MVPVIAVREYLAEDGTSPFGAWFRGLDSTAAAFVTVALARLGDGNTSRMQSIGHGAAELKIDRGPGYRVYVGWDGRTMVILLGGGTKRRQSADIRTALAHWQDYKSRKSNEART